eukprot:Seg1110.2 transcript_id=Seg1110.2/GoldUCD/mRNA.D3Y31 product="hypothetical protein" pseudo=true protein_id=Seg1110.2/GoldUCD/D3Y31
MELEQLAYGRGCPVDAIKLLCQEVGFTEDILRTHSLKGQRANSEAVAVKLGLDQQKLNVIVEIMTKFPGKNQTRNSTFEKLRNYQKQLIKKIK